MSKNNKSLTVYTVLIFVVAILMVTISFFGQSNLQKNQPDDSTEAASIAEKTAKLSEENMILLDNMKSLNTMNTELNSENKLLSEENEALKTEAANGKTLLAVCEYVLEGNSGYAKELISTLQESELTEAQLGTYNMLCKKLNIEKTSEQAE